MGATDVDRPLNRSRSPAGDCLFRIPHYYRVVFVGMAIGMCSVLSPAAVLPEQRVDTMYHYYDGGGVQVTGPALLIRKNMMAEKISITGSYYADTVSSASIDVVTTASPFKETRTEFGAGVEYLHNDSTMSLSVMKSEEPDYIADSMSLSLAQDIFGGMTTVTMGYSRGQDTVRDVSDPSFSDHVNRYQYRLGVSQILTQTLRVNLDYEAITDEGFLNSPYRTARIFGAGVPERYPRSRDSQAVALRSVKLFLPRSSARLEYRYFWDTWKIAANSVEAAYTFPVRTQWLMELRYRYYSQSKASFYSDDFTQLQNFMARDKELSTFKSHALGGKLTYALQRQPRFVAKSTLNVTYDRLVFDYDDFTDIRTQTPYNLEANVVQLFLSLWF